MYQRILVPLDGSSRAEQALPVAARLALRAHGVVILLQVVRPAGARAPAGLQAAGLTPTHQDGDRATAAAYLTKVAARGDMAGVPSEIVVREGAPGETILAVAKASSADLIVLCNQGHGGVSRFLLGSVAGYVVRRADVPILLLRERRPLLAATLPPDQACALRVLVPLDASLFAEAALEPAAELLAALGASEHGWLHLAQVIPDRGEWRRAARYLARVAERLRGGSVTGRPLRVSWSVIPHVDAAEALARVAELGEDAEAVTSWAIARDLGLPSSQPGSEAPPRGVGGGFGGCDLVVMSTHGRSGFRRWILGSVAEGVLSRAEVPLLLVPTTPDMLRRQPVVDEPDVEQWRV